MKPETKAQLETLGVSFSGTTGADVHFGFGATRSLLLEAPCQLRPGKFDVDRIGAYTYLGGGATVFRHMATIGRFCSIASNIITGQVEHPPYFLSAHPMFQGGWETTWPEINGFYQDNADTIQKSSSTYLDEQQNRFGKIRVGNDVWIGEGVFLRRGIKIGDGAIIASRSVVVSDVPPFSIFGGIPAKLIRLRFDVEIVVELKRLRWWDYGLSALAGVDFTDIEQAVQRIDDNIRTGRAEPMIPRLVRVHADGSVTRESETGETVPMANTSPPTPTMADNIARLPEKAL
ncbi:acetyltransferase [Skermanella stibiiresistens SB22]|uniref:Acetyltransferase n=1 Tax=Skermanella stibiiresistens SB22 TaxID=1385369 RepID=W9HCZ0_9PROT|nr:CatB-related O-acetyltransferase [Skermanella stibiiresistens]EWY42572.1 acetyltransferase [Skermanella stibiiresistens SB22]